MPSLERLSLSEISQRFTKEDEFYMHSYSEGMFSYVSVTGLAYQVTFFPSPFATLGPTCFIDDLVVAIDESKHFELSLLLG